MSDVITKVGKVVQNNGLAARVVHIEDGIAFGFDSAGTPCGWDVKTGEDSTWTSEPAPGYDIIGPWIDPPAFKPSDLVIEQPFRISEHGPGVYETREGKEAHVIGRECGVTWPWVGYINDEDRFSKTWKDCGAWQTREEQNDLVRYIGPLPSEAPQPVWTCTPELRDRRVSRDGGNPIPEGAQWRFVEGNWRCVIPEQKWVRGTEHEWRAVPITTEGA